ncbi:MAG: SAM-dependent methyltransferase [Actinomycetota bacterium]|nr:SAM-dependent methyltransferase [Actinomycetota bacterium]
MGELPSVEQAWRAALFDSTGFYREQWPARHFSTAANTGPDLAWALSRLARTHDLDTVVDVGAGGGELLEALHAVDPSLHLLAVELRPRPARLPPRIRWQRQLPTELHGLVVGNELLDTVPCPVVKVDAGGTPRVLLVDIDSGAEHLGPTVQAADVQWLERWWPTATPGSRAELGRPRDDVWAAMLDRVSHGLAVAIDYGHHRTTRPTAGSLRSYRRGHRVPVTFDGTADITADVALDAVADRVGGSVHRQRDVLDGSWLAPAGRSTDVSGRLDELVRAGRRAEVRAAGGLGELCWIISTRG